MTEPGGDALLDYLAARGISERSIAEFQLGAVLRPEECEPIMVGRISIPYLTPTGALAIRYMQPPPRDKGPKYWQPSGSRLGIYNTRVLAEGGPRVICVEGEMDTVILHQLGLPAVGFPGASSWRDHYHAIFDGYSEVIIIGDNDESPKVNEDGTTAEMASEKFTKKIASQVPNPRIVMMPRGHDVNSLYVSEGAEALLDLIKFQKGWG